MYTQEQIQAEYQARLANLQNQANAALYPYQQQYQQPYQNPYQQMPQQQQTQQPQMVRTYTVSNVDEVKGQLAPPTGEMCLFFNPNQKEIYTKQMNNNGISEMHRYILNNEQPEEKINYNQQITNLTEQMQNMQNELNKLIEIRGVEDGHDANIATSNKKSKSNANIKSTDA